MIGRCLIRLFLTGVAMYKYLYSTLFINYNLSFCSVFDIDDNTVPVQYRNGFTFITPNEQVNVIV